VFRFLPAPVVLVLAAGLLVLTAGCGSLPYGIDGDVTDDWHPPPRAESFRPAATGCFDKLESTAPLTSYAPFDCTERHVAEAFFVGDLPTAATDTTTGRKAAATECSKRADVFTGAEWRTGRLRLQPVLPGAEGWAAGARWFRCDLAEVDPGTDRVVSRDGSLKGALSGAAALALRCFNPSVRGGDVRAMPAAPCDKDHHAEFTGLWTAPDIALDKLEGDSRMAAGCQSSIADFAGVPDDKNMQYRAGWLAFAPSRSEWAAGIREVQCFLWLADEKMRTSYKDAGPTKLPIHYA
jgi:hypothetical protein